MSSTNYQPLVRFLSPQGAAVGIRPKDVVGVYPAGSHYNPAKPISSINLSAKSWVLVAASTEEVLAKLEAAERGETEDREIARLQDRVGELAGELERDGLTIGRLSDKLRAAMAVVELVRDCQMNVIGQPVDSLESKRYFDRLLMAELPEKE